MRGLAAILLMLLSAVLSGHGKFTTADPGTPAALDSGAPGPGTATSGTPAAGTVTTGTPAQSAAGTGTPTEAAIGTGTPGTVTTTPAPPTPVNGNCFAPPYNTLNPCTLSPTPTRALIGPTKTMSVSGGSSEPAGTTLYTVNLTSKFVCFALNEPIEVLALGSANAAALTAIQPATPSQRSSISVLPDPKTGTAQLALEVWNAGVGPDGLTLKAVWPSEGIVRVQNIMGPTSPSSDATALPGAAADTATPVGTPTTTGASQPFSLRACVDPDPVTTGGSATLYGQTTPGAICTASVVDPEGTPKGFSGASQLALADGLVVFPFTVGQTPGSGVGVVQCTYNGQTLRTTTTFTIQPPATAGPTATGGSANAPAALPTATPGGTGRCPAPPRQGGAGLYVITCVSPNPLPYGATATIYARTVPGASCTPQVIYSDGNKPTALNTSPRYTDPTGLVSFSFFEQTQATSGTATVTCTLTNETAQDSAQFTISH